MSADQVSLFTATAPTPNGALHVGHLSGPYLACDVAAAAARARGEQVLTMCGLDPHQNYVVSRSKDLDQPVDAVLNWFEGEIRQALAAVRIDVDLFLSPREDAGYRSAVADLLSELVQAKAAVLAETELLACAGCGRTLHHVWVSGRCPVCGGAASGGGCEGCGSLLAATDIRAARSTCCGARGRPFTARVPVLRLADYRDQLTEVWARATMPERVRRLVGGYLTGGLPTVPLAYPSDWGIRWDGPDGELRVDVWAEMGLGYLYAVPRHLGHTGDCGPGWRLVDKVWNFFGIDNAPYYAILFPGLFAAAGIRPGWLGGLVVNEFYRLDGAKFSTSRDHAIWANELLADEDPAVVRLFLCWDRPDRQETDFTWASYRAFRDWYQRAGALPGDLADAELDRAERALRPGGFDAALAVRCALGAARVRPERAAALLAVLAGEGRGA
jgi:methionyl-tRNA synthetase